MDKKHLHHLWRYIRPIRPRYFLILAVVFGAISVYALRQNNFGMIQRREAVYQADKDGGDTEAALRDLRQFVYAHMNTDLTNSNNGIYPPIQLQHSYDRAIAAQKVTAPDNAAIYSQAQKTCEAQFPIGLSGSGRIPCVQSYIASHGITQQQAIPVSLYEFDFVSPKWSPDLAGWSLVATVGFGLLTITGFISDRWIKAELKD